MSYRRYFWHIGDSCHIGDFGHIGTIRYIGDFCHIGQLRHIGDYCVQMDIPQENTYSNKAFLIYLTLFISFIAI